MGREGVSDSRSLVVEELPDGSTNHCYIFIFHKGILSIGGLKTSSCQ